MLFILKVLFPAALLFEACGIYKVEAAGSGDGSSQHKKRVLYMAENKYFSHFKFAIQLANTLYDDNYDVDFVVADYEEGAKPVDLNPRINYIPVPIADKEFEDQFPMLKNPVDLWKDEVFTSETPNFWESIRYRSVNLYRAIIKNQVKVGGKHILDYLLLQKYDLGMAEFLFVTSAFALFYHLNIKNTAATSATPGLPVAYHILGYEIPANLPELLVCYPGDGKIGSELEKEGSKRQKENKEEYRKFITRFIKFYETGYQEMYTLANELIQDQKTKEKFKWMPSLKDLLNKVQYFFVNQHHLTRYPSPQIDKVKFIGGLEVEKMDMFKNKWQKEHIRKDNTENNKNKAKKGRNMMLFRQIKFFGNNAGVGRARLLANAEHIVVFSLGTIVEAGEKQSVAIERIFDIFGEQSNCQFIVRVDKKVLDFKEAPKNVHIAFMEDKIPLKELLTLENVHGIIHQCGQNTLTEALYAGVPMICIPFLGDQYYNASLVEYMGVGSWLQHTYFMKDIEPDSPHLLAIQLNELLDNSYKSKAEQIAEAILKSKPSKTIFLEAVKGIFNGTAQKIEHQPIKEHIEFIQQDKSAFMEKNQLK